MGVSWNCSVSLTAMNAIQNQTKADVLIVDDIPDNIRFLSNFLLEQGYHVRKAINGQMALKVVAALAPDLILLDVNMPDMQGYEVCRQLKQNPATCSIPIIFLSAGNESIDKVKAFESGGVDYITKPFQLEEVLARVQTQLTIQGLQKELKEQNHQLQQALHDLKLAQVNLVQQEKMATLRKIVAGVAHEINNPLSFIACNIRPAQDYVQQLLSLITIYQERFPTSDPTIAQMLDDLDLDFMKADLLNLLNSIGNGAERIHTVILALRIFARLDESGIKQVNLHEGIDSMLALLHYRLSSLQNGWEMQVKKDYGDLPLVTCYSEQMNQVIFHLLCNAIDAVQEKLDRQGYDKESPQITISTRLINDQEIEIGIRDNGIGIAAAAQPRIFEPFFTTKPAGRGVGLGLATCQNIIEEMHQGKLSFRSSAQEGTEFLVQMPL